MFRGSETDQTIPVFHNMAPFRSDSGKDKSDIAEFWLSLIMQSSIITNVSTMFMQMLSIHCTMNAVSKTELRATVYTCAYTLNTMGTHADNPPLTVIHPRWELLRDHDV